MSDHRNSTTASEVKASDQPLDQQTYAIVCKMEQPLWSIHDLLTAIGLMATTDLAGDDAIAAVQRLVMYGDKAFREAEKLRSLLFHMNHPRRDELAKERENG
jgi:hypothetical protein